MYLYLKERAYYEDLYDRNTVERAREGAMRYEKFLYEFKKKIPKDDTLDLPRNAVIVNAFYMQAVGLRLLDRYDKRTQTIDEWLARDEAKDQQISAARLTIEPKCQNCKKIGLCIIDKSFMYRKERGVRDEEVLFMLECPHCDKRSAYWMDGKPWVTEPVKCPQCGSLDMQLKSRRTKSKLTITNTCSACANTIKEGIDLSDNKPTSDPEYETDKAKYRLLDNEFREHLSAIKSGFEEAAVLGRQMEERRINEEKYKATADIKKLSIVELKQAIQPAVEENGYIEFSLDKPQIGREFAVPFSCLDGKPERDSYKSEKVLKKTIAESLNGTNWRLMSDGVSYRLGYLSGRLRAYESDEDLLKLVDRK